MNRRRGWAAVVVVSLLLLTAADLRREPAEQLTARALLAGIGLYRANASQRLGRAGVRCRFHPSCSRYGEISIRRHGALGGSLRTLGRLARCAPWTRRGTVDPP